MKGSCGSRSVPVSVSSAKMSSKFVDFIELPDLPVDIIISYLEDKDLQCFHQVKRSWKSALESRPKENQRRKDLVQTIRENKENIRSRIAPDTPQEPTLPALAQRAIRERNSQDVALKKMGNFTNMALMECTNQFETTPTSTSVSNAVSAVSTPIDTNSFLTPTSHFVFQDFQKAEESLTPGQKLFQCRKCRGPVPSPATPVMDSRDSSRRHSQPNRVKLISRLEGEDFTHYPPHLESPQKRECKKAKTLSSVDLSPIPYMSPAVTVASLGEKMSHSLVLSAPCLTSTASTDFNALPPLSSPGEYPVKRSTSCSSIMAIDLPQKLGEICSPIELNLNGSSLMDNDNSSFFSHHHHHGLSSVDLSNSLNCSRSCCSPRRIHHSQLHSSHFSDSGLSFEGESLDSSVFAPRDYLEYTNMIPSPVVPKASSQFGQDLGYHHNSSTSIERGRDVVNFSDGALSLSSFSHLHRSDHSLDFNCNSMNITDSEPVISSDDVLECPNPKCGFRFCSKCEESEHPGRSCHMVSSDQFESFASYENSSFGGDNISNISSSGNIKSSNKKSNVSSSSGKSNKHKNQKKIPLRRLARL